MKDTKTYEKKIKKILTQCRGSKPRKGAEPDDIFAVMVEGVLASDNNVEAARKALDVIEEEFVDFNELRVSPVKDIAECLGRDYPLRRQKAVEVTTAMNGVFYRVNDMSAEYMHKMPKTAVRRHLAELGLGTYAAAWVALTAFGIRALPVDQTLLESLELNGDLPEGLSLEEAQKFLERAVGKGDMAVAHAAMRKYVDKHAKALDRKRKADAKARADAEAKAKAEAEAKAKAEAKAQALAEAKAEAKAQEQAARKAAKKSPKKAAKKSARTSPQKAAGKAVKKSAKKSIKKVRKAKPKARKATRAPRAKKKR